MRIPILVIDDEPHFLELMLAALGRRGFSVQTAATARAALALIESESFQLAVIDVRLGYASGIDVLAELKARQPQVRAVVVTGLPSDEIRAHAMARGADAFLSKPLAVAELVEKLAALSAAEKEPPRPK
jgi:DNA-binding response OmpR family regulator